MVSFKQVGTVVKVVFIHKKGGKSRYACKRKPRQARTVTKTGSLIYIGRNYLISEDCTLKIALKKILEFLFKGYIANI